MGTCMWTMRDSSGFTALQCVAVRCSCSVLQCVMTRALECEARENLRGSMHCSVLPCCSALQCVAGCCRYVAGSHHQISRHVMQGMHESCHVCE